MTNVYTVILGLLHDRPLYGYEIKHIIGGHMGDWTDIKFGSIYFALSRLSEDGMAELVHEGSEGSRPARRIYRITQKGREEYLRLLRAMWKEDKRTLYPMDIAVFFMDSLPKEEVSAYISARARGDETALKRIDAHEAEQNAHMPRQGRYIFAHSRLHIEAELEWLKGMMRDLQD
jgi:Predicted transcriptional regulators